MLKLGTIIYRVEDAMHWRPTKIVTTVSILLILGSTKTYSPVVVLSVKGPSTGTVHPPSANYSFQCLSHILLLTPDYVS